MPQCSVRDVCAGEVVRVHLLAVRVKFAFYEEVRMGDAGAAPDYVGGLVVVPCCCFGDGAGCFCGGG